MNILNHINKLITFCLLSVCTLQAGAQGIRNDGANIVVSSGAWVYIDGGANGNFLNENGGLIDIDGDIVVEGDWTNNAVNNVFTNRIPSDGWVRFKGTGTETIGGTADTRFEYVEFDNSSGGTPITLSRNVIVEGICRFTDGVVVTGANTLIIESTTGADVVGHSNASFVNGNLRRFIGNNTDTYPFPVGNGLIASDYYLAELINGNLTGAGFNYIDAKFGPLANHNNGDIVETEEGTSYTSVGAEGVWFLNPDVAPTGGDYDLQLYTANFAGLQDNMFTILSRPTGSLTAADWSCNPCGFGVGINANGGLGRMVADGYALRLGMTGFSQKGIGKTDAVLPIELIAFYAECVDEAVLLTWLTASESNNDFFTVDKKSADGEFVNIGTVSGAGTSNIINEYELYDVNPVEGLTYYRLRQTDYDGNFSYNGPVVVNCEEEESPGFAIMPNPTSEYLNVVCNIEGDHQAVFTVHDKAGRLVYHKTLTGDFKHFIANVESLAPGLYQARLVVGGHVFNERFVKL